jgi:geranylgeranyl diphosphate synthase type II
MQTHFQESIEAALEQHLPQRRRAGAELLDGAIRYAVFPGGKRIRPVLCLLGARVFAPDFEPALAAACASEFIHTSSLLFDDLPCMDDAHTRRGRPVVHAVFGEDVALLAGLALLNQSYSIFGRTPALIAEAAACIGVDGMIGGQALDLAQTRLEEKSQPQIDDHLMERNRKTSALMRLALISGALACGVPPCDVEVLGQTGQSLGEAYQIGDDLLDAKRSSHETGKNAGQDRRHNRPCHGELVEGVCLGQLDGLIADARAKLTRTYGATRIVELMTFVDAMFAKLTAVRPGSIQRGPGEPHLPSGRP